MPDIRVIPAVRGATRYKPLRRQARKAGVKLGTKLSLKGALSQLVAVVKAKQRARRVNAEVVGPGSLSDSVSLAIAQNEGACGPVLWMRGHGCLTLRDGRADQLGLGMRKTGLGLSLIHI